MSTQVFVDTARKIGTLDRHIFGGFIEHLGRCIYGGIYEPGSPMSNNEGFRLDVLTLLRELRLSVVRWPGGNFASNYHWKDGIGPADTRPARPDVAWGGVESNRFGTDEYIRWCRTLDVEPFICLNMGSGTLAEALEWVEYCNGTSDTYWARQRRNNGSTEPHSVRWWALGNEMYGAWQTGVMSATEYVAEARRWGRAIKTLDPSAKLVACGEVGWTDWDAEVTAGLADLCDLYSIHAYTGSDDYVSNVVAPHIVERGIKATTAMLQRTAYLQRLPTTPRIAIDEWNVWFRGDSHGLEERYVLSDALAVGIYLNIFVRHCDVVEMTNLAQLVNAIAPVVTTPETAVTQPIYLPFLLHAQGHLDHAVDTYVVGPTLDEPINFQTPWPQRIDDLGQFMLLDVAATVDRAQTKAAITIANRSDTDETVHLHVREREFSGNVRLRWIEGPTSPSAIEGVQTLHVNERAEVARGSIFKVTLPARSFVLLEGRLAG